MYGRAWFRCSRPRPDLAAAPAVRLKTGQWQVPAHREPSLLGPGEFLFLGQEGRLSEVGWDGPQREKLWRYNQHYFDDLNAANASLRHEWHHALLRDWLDNNEPGQGNAWEPYPTSLRIVNWIKWILAGNEMPTGCLQSLAVQARWLMNRLEYHLLGNHLFTNAKALVFAGLFFEGDEANHWLRKGLRILEREIPEQILSDGGHFERSTMYHALALEDMLDLCNLVSCYSTSLTPETLTHSTSWRDTAVSMMEWLTAMRHPDGEISFFNDAALGIAPSCHELVAYAERLGVRSTQMDPGDARWLSQSGYVRMARGNAVALLDMAALGPDYLLGHAHADTLSFELSVSGQRILVNSGTSCYGNSAERLRQRGTAAHNTVIVSGNDSSEVWGGFRVARRARPVSPEVRFTSDGLFAQCAHDGYARLPGKPVHTRQWEMYDNSFVIHDSVDNPELVSDALFHFHPDVKIEADQHLKVGEVVLADGKRIRWQVDKGRPSLKNSTWHPRFGSCQPSQCLTIRLDEGRSSLQFNWS